LNSDQIWKKDVGSSLAPMIVSRKVVKCTTVAGMGDLREGEKCTEGYINIDLGGRFVGQTRW